MMKKNNEKKLVIILDPAHGEDVAGKRSPCGTHLEYEWSRKILGQLYIKLIDHNYRVEYTTISELEPGLSYRRNIASKIEVNNDQSKLMISLHNNAAGIGTEWMKARGIEIFTTIGETKSDKYAKIVYDQLKSDFPDLTFRGLKESNFAVLKGSNYYAMLIEWLFQDNKEDVELLKNETVNNELIESLFKAIEKINETL